MSPPRLTATRAAFLLVVVFCPACDGRSVGVPRGDAGPSSGRDAEAVPDASVVLPEACEGPAWVAGPDQPPRPVTVTSTALAMDCCDGATAHFHTHAQLGHDLAVMLQAWGGWPEAGTWDLATLGPNAAMEARLYDPEGATSAELALEGWVSLAWEGEPWVEPLLLSICVAKVEGDPAWGGLRLWSGRLPVMPWGWWERFGVHLLEDPTVTAAEAAARPLGALALDPEPVVSLGNLAWYERSSHTLRFDPWYGDRLLGILPPVGVSGLPFVVVVDEEPIYLGAFYTALSSESFGHPVIVIEDIAEGAATIERAYPGPGAATGPDPRPDPRLFELLEAAAKLAP